MLGIELNVDSVSFGLIRNVKKKKAKKKSETRATGRRKGDPLRMHEKAFFYGGD